MTTRQSAARGTRKSARPPAVSEKGAAFFAERKEKAAAKIHRRMQRLTVTMKNNRLKLHRQMKHHKKTQDSMQAAIQSLRELAAQMKAAEDEKELNALTGAMERMGVRSAAVVPAAVPAALPVVAEVVEVNNEEEANNDRMKELGARLEEINISE